MTRLLSLGVASLVASTISIATPALSSELIVVSPEIIFVDDDDDDD